MTTQTTWDVSVKSTLGDTTKAVAPELPATGENMGFLLRKSSRVMASAAARGTRWAVADSVSTVYLRGRSFP
jgi:hypothetical protein